MSKALFMELHCKDGEVYAGIMLGENGEPDYHLFILPGDADSAPWKKQMDWAKSIGGELPTRREQRVLYANCKEHFKSAWYWSGEQHADGSDFAWDQYFVNGGQYYLSKSDSGRARAVRRLVIL